MRKLFLPLLVILLFVFTFNSYAQENSVWKWQHETPQGNTLRWVEMFDANIWYAGGYSGTFIKTTDAGLSWTFHHKVGRNYGNSGQKSSDYDAHWFTQNHGIVVGSSGTIAITNDGGTTWVEPTTNPLLTTSTITLYQIYFMNDNVGYIAGTTGTLLKTTDGGNNWALISAGVTSNFYDVYTADDVTINVATTSGNIRRTTDGGTTWATVNTGATTVMYKLHFIDALRGFSAGSTGKCYTTADGGATWTAALGTGSIVLPSTATFYDIDNVGSTIYLTGYSFYNFKSTDNGTTWDTVGVVAPVAQQPWTSTYYASDFSATGEPFLTVGAFGLINKRTSVSDIKTYTTLVKPGQINDVWSNASGKIITVGAPSSAGTVFDQFMYSTDNGATWKISATTKGQSVQSDKPIFVEEQQNIEENKNSIDVVNPKSAIWALQMLNDNDGFACGTFGAIYKTTNGGVSWDSVAAGIPNTITLKKIDFVNANVGWVFASAPSTATNVSWKTTDGGATWVAQTLYTAVGTIWAADMVNENVGYIANNNPKPWKTTDGGATWVAQAFVDGGYTAGYVYDVQMFDQNNGYMTGSAGRFYKTTNGGANWDTLTVPTRDYVFYNLSFIDQNIGMVVGYTGVSFNTTDGGATWGSINTNGSNMYNVNYRTGDAKAITDFYSVGSNGYIFKAGITTPNPQVSSFPYVQSWDGVDFLPTGWTQSSPTSKLFTRVTAGTYPTCVPKDGTHMLKYACYDYSSGANATLVSPEFAFPAGDFKVKFWMYRDAGYVSSVDKVEIYYNTENNAATATLLGTINRNMTLAPVVAAAGWYEYSFDLPNTTTGSGRVIMLKAISAYGNNIYLDKFSVEEISNVSVDWCNLQWPLTSTIMEGESVTVYAQAYINGVTLNPGATPNLDCWIGVSSTDTDPATWTNWIPATFNVNSGNNDEFMANIGSDLPQGTYYYASKFQYLGGIITYGGTGGFWNNNSGVLTVNPLTINNFPLVQGFESTTFPPAGWVKEDLNGGKPWVRLTTSPHTGLASAAYAYSSTLPGDDYLFTPALNLQAGKTYYISYYYKAGSTNYAEKMKVVIGDAPSAASVDSVLADHPNILSVTYLNNMVYFTAPTSGLYYVGFQCYSDADMLNLYLDDVEIGIVLDNDYAITELVQIDAIPNPFKESIDLKGVPTETTLDVKSVTGVVSRASNNYVPVYSSEDFTTNLVSYINSTPFAEGYRPVNLYARVKNQGLLSNPYTFNYSFNGVAGSAINKPGLPFNGMDSLGFSATPTARGTFTTITGIVSAGDTTNVLNNAKTNFKTLVYPDPMIKIKYDNGSNIQSTYIGLGVSTSQFTAAVRFKATENMRLANIDAFYRNEANADSVTVKVWAAGTDSLAPGTLIYVKKFAGENYITAGDAGAYVTLPLGNNAPTFLTDQTYWVGIQFAAAITYPLGAHNTGFVPGHSFYTANDTLWSPLVITTERAWMIRVIGIPYTPPQYNTLWERSASQNNMPSWFLTTHLERGLAFGNTTSATKSNPRVFVASRNGGTFVKIIDAVTGTDAGELNTTGLAGGTYVINDVECSADGKIFAGNLTLNISTSPFKVYMWDNETSLAVNVISYSGGSLAARIGDKFTVVGDYSAGTAVVYAASATAGIPKVFKWTMAGGVFVNEPTVISLSDNVTTGTPSSASVGPLPNGDFYWKGTSFPLKKYTADGTLVGTIATTIIASGGNAVRYIGEIGDYEFVAVFQYGAGNENCKLLKVPKATIADATIYDVTPTLGTNVNTNGAGDVAIGMRGDGTADIYVLSTNNGLGAYRTISPVPVELTSFIASADNGIVTLSWITATEVNSKEYVIERQSGSSWVAVGSVNAAGTTTEPKEYTFTEKISGSSVYSYRLKMIDLDGTFAYSSVVEVEIGLPATFQLSQNYPNPFNPTTRVNYSVPVDSKVTFELYDITGQRVAVLFNADIKAGYYTLDISANSYRLASGVYIYRMTASSLTDGKNFVNSKKFVLLK
ncbi:MAG: YCF48-related protein [bacterium]